MKTFLWEYKIKFEFHFFSCVLFLVLVFGLLSLLIHDLHDTWIVSPFYFELFRWGSWKSVDHLIISVWFIPRFSVMLCWSFFFIYFLNTTRYWCLILSELRSDSGNLWTLYFFPEFCGYSRSYELAYTLERTVKDFGSK